mmetsp:Transcript_28907/g.74180  ORF Transcript_28907/g.74180 Transcript_28907/m.74180 type:complete len:151 (+) Transcript_28907:1381-1833(+)
MFIILQLTSFVEARQLMELMKDGSHVLGQVFVSEPGCCNRPRALFSWRLGLLVLEGVDVELLLPLLFNFTRAKLLESSLSLDVSRGVIFSFCHHKRITLHLFLPFFFLVFKLRLACKKVGLLLIICMKCIDLALSTRWPSYLASSERREG